MLSPVGVFMDVQTNNRNDLFWSNDFNHHRVVFVVRLAYDELVRTVSVHSKPHPSWLLSRFHNLFECFLKTFIISEMFINSIFECASGFRHSICLSQNGNEEQMVEQAAKANPFFLLAESTSFLRLNQIFIRHLFIFL